MTIDRPDRRRFLGRFLGGVAGLAAAPALTDPGELFAGGEPPPLEQAAARPDERYWRQVKDQFPLRPGLILMNAANLCPSPYPVQRTLFEYTRDMDADASFQNRGKFSDLRERARSRLAGYLGADADEIAIVRNTSEANNVVVGGLDLGPGDEVVLWDQNHPTNDVAWDVRAERYGFTVRRVTTPRSPDGPDELVAPLLEALGASTRVLAFSHVSNVSGVALPARRLCRAARERGIWTLVDGAQSFGALELDLHDMGCDFYTGSVDKWPMGPEETGLLYVRKQRVSDLWPEIVGVGWDSAGDSGSARRFETLGQRDEAAVAAVATAVEFHRTIGPAVVEARVRELATAVMEALRERVPGVRFHTPEVPELRAGVVVFDAPGIDPGESFDRLYREHDVGGAPRGEPFAGLRLSPHVYNTLDEVDRAAEAVAAVL